MVWVKNNEKYGVYQKKFSLRDIFNDKSLQEFLPMVNYAENGITEKTNKIAVITRMKSFGRTVYDISVKNARPYYRPLNAHKKGNYIDISGNAIADLNEPTNAIYNALKGEMHTLSFLVNNMDCIRSALKESEKNKRETGQDTELYLRISSKQEIREMMRKNSKGINTINGSKLSALMNNIMENIYYGDGFEETRKKFGLENVKVGDFSYEENKARWRRRVGYGN